MRRLIMFGCACLLAGHLHATLNDDIIWANQGVSQTNARLNEMDQIKANLGLSLRCLDGPYAALFLESNMDMRRNRFDSVGIKAMIKLGASHEEKLIEELYEEIEALKRQRGVK